MKRVSLIVGLCGLLATQVQAIPALQLYIEGATYDSASETWVADVTSGDPIRLWAIGNLGQLRTTHPTIYDVKLAVAFEAGKNPTITLKGSTTGGYQGFLDPSTPPDINTVWNYGYGTIPLLSDGSELPSHGVYGAGVDWQEFMLGDFNQQDSQMADFINSVPTAESSPQQWGQINVYEITVTGTDWVHFDLYDHIESASRGRIKYVFAPFSHDAEGMGVPDGGMTLVLLGIGLAGLAVASRQRAAKAA